MYHMIYYNIFNNHTPLSIGMLNIVVDGSSFDSDGSGRDTYFQYKQRHKKWPVLMASKTTSTDRTTMTTIETTLLSTCGVSIGYNGQFCQRRWWG